MTRRMMLLWVILVFSLAVLTGCNSPSPTAIFATAVTLAQSAVGTDYTAWAIGVNASSNGAWHLPETIPGGIALAQAEVDSYQAVKNQGTDASVSVAAVLGAVKTPTGSGADLLSAFHATDRR